MGRTKGCKTGTYGARIIKTEFEKLCGFLCTEQEICGYFDVSHDTLNRWCHQEYGCTFTGIYSQKSACAKVSLRRIQFKHAETNPSMAIFLGKQYLGQSDTVEQKTTNRIEIVNDIPKDDGE